MLETIVGSRARTEILRLLFTPERPTLHLRELAAMAGLSTATLSCELRKFVVIEAIGVTRQRGANLYRANEEHPFFTALCDLVRREYGVIAAITAALSGDDVLGAHILADGITRPTGILEIRVCSELPYREINRRLQAASNAIGREIRFSVMPSKRYFAVRDRRKWHVLKEVEGERSSC